MGIKAIDKSTFDAVYEENAEKVYRIALYYSGNHHAAEDITQAVFMKLYMNMENVNPERIEPWIKTIAKHMALNYRRHAKHEVELPVEEVTNLMEKTVYKEDIEEFLAIRRMRKVRTDLIETIYADLYQKNPQWYEALTITCILEKPQNEVAKTMGIPVGTLRVILHRARCWIRKQYQEQLDHLNDT